MLPHRPRNRSSSHGDREPKFAQPRSQPRMPAAQLSKARIDVDSRDQMPSRSRERSRDAQDRVGCRLLAGRTTWTAGAAGRGRSSRTTWQCSRNSWRKPSSGYALRLPSDSLQRGMQPGRGACGGLLRRAQRSCCQRKNGHLRERRGHQSSRHGLREGNAITITCKGPPLGRRVVRGAVATTAMTLGAPRHKPLHRENKTAKSDKCHSNRVDGLLLIQQ
jgi:hypothetical protein